MLTTCILTLIMCALLFLMIWSAAYFLPWKGLMDFFPEDIKEKAKDHAPPFRTAPIFGWICMILCMLGFIGVIVYGGWDGVQRNYTFGQFLVRFLIILFGVKAFDIIGLDLILITKTHFFQHYFPETEGCAGYHNFGFNRKEQIRQIIMMPFAALLTAWICTLF
ncbi:MAG: hypothetical protein IJI61_08465 [Oscillospiraceae bacterium]|nr:hypothetical protein [Oscillospiraceae bacterium]